MVFSHHLHNSLEKLNTHGMSDILLHFVHCWADDWEGGQTKARDLPMARVRGVSAKC